MKKQIGILGVLILSLVISTIVKGEMSKDEFEKMMMDPNVSMEKQFEMVLKQMPQRASHPKEKSSSASSRSPFRARAKDTKKAEKASATQKALIIAKAPTHIIPDKFIMPFVDKKGNYKIISQITKAFPLERRDRKREVVKQKNKKLFDFCASLAGGKGKNWRLMFNGKENSNFYEKNRSLKFYDLNEKPMPKEGILTGDFTKKSDVRIKALKSKIYSNIQRGVNHYIGYPVCIADSTPQVNTALHEARGKVAAKEKEALLKSEVITKPYPIAGIQKVEMGEVYLGMTVPLDKSGKVIKELKPNWNRHSYVSGGPKVFERAFGGQMGLALNICSKKLKSNSQYKPLLPSGRQRGSRALDWFNNLIDFKRVKFSTNSKGKSGKDYVSHNYELVLDQDNRVVAMDVVRIFDKAMIVNANKIDSAILKKYGEPKKVAERKGNSVMHQGAKYPGLSVSFYSVPNHPQNLRNYGRNQHAEVNLPFRLENAVRYGKKSVSSKDTFLIINHGNSMRFVAYRWDMIWGKVEKAQETCQASLRAKLDEIIAQDEGDELSL